MIAIRGTSKTDCCVRQSRRAASFRNEYTLSISSQCAASAASAILRTGPTVRVCAREYAAPMRRESVCMPARMSRTTFNAALHPFSLALSLTRARERAPLETRLYHLIKRGSHARGRK